MGFRFRKSFPFGKLLRFNVSGSGVSVGVGPPGLNFNIGPRGIRRTVGLPGTGVFYQDIHGWPKGGATNVTSGAAPTVIAPSNGGVSWVTIIIVLVVAVIGFRACSDSTSTPPPGATKAVTPVAVAKPPAPPPDRPLTRDEVRELQQLFKKQGFNVGPVDGLVGPRTRLVMQTFAKKAGLVGSTEPTLHLLEAARARKN